MMWAVSFPGFQTCWTMQNEAMHSSKTKNILYKQFIQNGAVYQMWPCKDGVGRVTMALPCFRAHRIGTTAATKRRHCGSSSASQHHQTAQTPPAIKISREGAEHLAASFCMTVCISWPSKLLHAAPWLLTLDHVTKNQHASHRPGDRVVLEDRSSALR